MGQGEEEERNPFCFSFTQHCFHQIRLTEDKHSTLSYQDELDRAAEIKDGSGYRLAFVVVAPRQPPGRESSTFRALYSTYALVWLRRRWPWKEEPWRGSQRRNKWTPVACIITPSQTDMSKFVSSGNTIISLCFHFRKIKALFVNIFDKVQLQFASLSIEWCEEHQP